MKKNPRDVLAGFDNFTVDGSARDKLVWSSSPSSFIVITERCFAVENLKLQKLPLGTLEVTVTLSIHFRLSQGKLFSKMVLLCKLCVPSVAS